MCYKFDQVKFDKTFKVTKTEKNNKLSYSWFAKTSIFPYTTKALEQEKAEVSMEKVLGNYVCEILNKKNCEPIDYETLEDVIIGTNGYQNDDFEIEEDEIDSFRNIIQSVFYDDKSLRHLNFSLLQYNSSDDPRYKKLAAFLFANLGDSRKVEAVIKEKINDEKEEMNALERLVNDNIEKAAGAEGKDFSKKDYGFYQIFTGLSEKFNKDLEFITSSKQRSRKYLGKLLDFYYFMYVAQVSVYLGRTLSQSKDRNEVIPYYFSLDWEQTDQSRECYENGWKALSPSVDKIFIHAVALTMLNQIEKSDVFYDYNAIYDLANSPDGKEVFEEVKKIVEYFLTIGSNKNKADCQEVIDSIANLKEGVGLLFESLRNAILTGSRRNPCNNYKNQYFNFVKKHFLKRRGRSGFMLNLTEDYLVLLTKLAINNQKKLRFNDVIKEIRERGVVFDYQSRELVIKYFERLNLIEKKSDSGDAQYVKQIL